jgi:hypothetical protein
LVLERQSGQTGNLMFDFDRTTVHRPEKEEFGQFGSPSEQEAACE